MSRYSRCFSLQSFNRGVVYRLADLSLQLRAFARVRLFFYRACVWANSEIILFGCKRWQVSFRDSRREPLGMQGSRDETYSEGVARLWCVVSP